jgi:hypothetical protein
MIVWTANRDPWLDSGNWAPAGSIAVIHGPDLHSAWNRYPSSYGACTAEYRDGDDNHRLQRIADLWRQFQDDDNMNMNHVAEAFRIVEGIERLSDFKGRVR